MCKAKEHLNNKHRSLKMTTQLNIGEKNTQIFKITKPVLLGTYRSDVTPVSNEKIKELYLRYKPRLFNKPIYLEEGFNEYLKNKKYQINNKFENLLEWLKANQHLLKSDVQLENNHLHNGLGVDFVASPGTLSALLKCPYELEHEFSLLAEKLNGTIYLKIKKKVSSFSIFCLVIFNLFGSIVKFRD